jgi:hypothetical protein
VKNLNEILYEGESYHYAKSLYERGASMKS